MNKNHTSVTISWERYYGLRLFCVSTDPKIPSSQKIEESLKNSDIPRVSKENFEKFYLKVKSGEMKLEEVPIL